MGLVKCPDCGREVSEQAEKCPHCGAPRAPITKRPGRRDRDFIQIGGGVLFALGMLMVLIAAQNADRPGAQGLVASGLIVAGIGVVVFAMGRLLF